MKKKILILVSLFLLFLIVLVPASLLDNIIPQKNNISLNGLSGSIWSGKISQVNMMGMQFDDISFSINPWALFLANLSVDLDIPKGEIKGELNIVLSSDYANNFILNDVNLALAASRLDGFLPIANVELGGTIKVTRLNAEVENKKPVLLNGQLSWENAALSYAGQQWLLGDFIIDAVTDDKHVIRGKLQKTNNKLGLEGVFTLRPNGLFEFVGSIATDTEQVLYQAVALFNNGKPANGRLPIKFKQKVL